MLTKMRKESHTCDIKCSKILSLQKLDLGNAQCIVEVVIEVMHS